MNAKTFARLTNANFRTLNEGTVKMEDNGYRVRAAGKPAADDLVEVSASYFFQTQANLNRAAETVAFYAPKGYRLEAVGNGDFYRDATWPKTSWASRYYRVVADTTPAAAAAE